jgi:hypothetical protein
MACDDGELADEDVFYSILSRARSKLERLTSIVKGSTRFAPNGQARTDRLAWIRQRPLLRKVTGDLQQVKQELHMLLDVRTA